VAFRSRWPATSDAVLLKVFLKKKTALILLSDQPKKKPKKEK
jgi:hypothetical protein